MRKLFFLVTMAFASIALQNTRAFAQANIQTFTNAHQWTVAASKAAKSGIVHGLSAGVMQFGGKFDKDGLLGAGPPGIDKFSTSPIRKLEFIPFIYAMGGYWDLSVGGCGEGLELDAQFHSGFQQTIGFIVNPISNVTMTRVCYKGFWGFVSDTPIQNVIYWSSDLVGQSEEFALEQVLLAKSPGPVSHSPSVGPIRH